MSSQVCSWLPKMIDCFASFFLVAGPKPAVLPGVPGPVSGLGRDRSGASDEPRFRSCHCGDVFEVGNGSYDFMISPELVRSA